MKALVVGGTGFIGSHIVNDLLSKGIQVRVLLRKKSNLSFQKEKKIEFIYGDITDLDSLENSTKDVDYVFSAFGILGRWQIPERTYLEVNTEGVKNLLQACLFSNIRQFLHVSSAGVLGPLPKNVIADESFPLKPSNAYEKSKSEAEKLILNYGRDNGIPFTIIRPEFVYGPGDTHVLGLFKAIKNKKFFILGKGKSFLHPTYVDDLIQGINLCIGNKNAIGQTFLITGKRPLSVKEIAQIIGEELDVTISKMRIPQFFAHTVSNILEIGGKIFCFEPVLTKARVKFFTENRAFSYQKAYSLLGYSPKIEFKEGASRTIHWYRENGYL